MDYPKRKPNRLPNFDYSQNGYYFVTICAHNRRSIFSDICVGQGLAPAEPKLSPYGKIAEKYLLDLENRYSNVKIDKYVIMPNHIHAIITIDNFSVTAGASPCPTLSDIICSFKSVATLYCKRYRDTDKIFQDSFYDHIIRGKKDYEEIWNYIENNPQKWKTDSLYSD